MLDQLPFDAEDPDKPRKHRRRKKNRTGLTLVLVCVLVGTLGIAGWFGFDKVRSFLIAEDYSGDGNGTATEVEIPEGAVPQQMGEVLYESEVVASAEAFVNAASANPEAQSIQPGMYELEEEMSGDAAVAALLDPQNRVTGGVTIREGMTHWTIYEELSESTGVPVEDFEAAGEDPEALGISDEWFERTDGEDVTPSVEGFLFPQTYDFTSEDSAEDMLSQMVTMFLKVAEESDFANQAEQNTNMSPYEALIVASLSEAEAGVPDDLGKVSRVAYNRITDEDHWCSGEIKNCLEFDSTTNYGLMLAGDDSKHSNQLTNDELYDEDNAYSTHARDGLPPGPINNPGANAMEGASAPPDGGWLYFVAIDQDGNSAFAETDEEHEQNKQEARENGAL